jgi:hypothetical protein
LICVLHGGELYAVRSPAAGASLTTLSRERRGALPQVGVPDTEL